MLIGIIGRNIDRQNPPLGVFEQRPAARGEILKPRADPDHQIGIAANDIRR